jgi:hypothetical protein
MTITWTMQDGQKIRPEDMSASHRANTINMVVRNTRANAETMERNAAHWLGISKHQEEILEDIFYAQNIADDTLKFCIEFSPAIALMVKLNDESSEEVW